MDAVITSWPPPVHSGTRTKALNEPEERALQRAYERQQAELGAASVQNVRLVCVAVIGALAVAAICTALGAGTLCYEMLSTAVRVSTAESVGPPTKSTADGRNWTQPSTGRDRATPPRAEITPAARA